MPLLVSSSRLVHLKNATRVSVSLVGCTTTSCRSTGSRVAPASHAGNLFSSGARRSSRPMRNANAPPTSGSARRWLSGSDEKNSSPGAPPTPTGGNTSESGGDDKNDGQEEVQQTSHTGSSQMQASTSSSSKPPAGVEFVIPSEFAKLKAPNETVSQVIEALEHFCEELPGEPPALQYDADGAVRRTYTSFVTKCSVSPSRGAFADRELHDDDQEQVLEALQCDADGAVRRTYTSFVTKCSVSPSRGAFADRELQDDDQEQVFKDRPRGAESSRENSPSVVGSREAHEVGDKEMDDQHEHDHVAQSAPGIKTTTDDDERQRGKHDYSMVHGASIPIMQPAETTSPSTTTPPHEDPEQATRSPPRVLRRFFDVSNSSSSNARGAFADRELHDDDNEQVLEDRPNNDVVQDAPGIINTTPDARQRGTFADRELQDDDQEQVFKDRPHDVAQGAPGINTTPDERQRGKNYKMVDGASIPITMHPAESSTSPSTATTPPHEDPEQASRSSPPCVLRRFFDVSNSPSSNAINLDKRNLSDLDFLIVAKLLRFAPNGSYITTLNLNDNAGGDRGLEFLVDHVLVPQQGRGPAPGDVGPRPGKINPGGVGLKSLFLSNNHISDPKAVQRLAGSLKRNFSLQTLELRKNRIDDEAVAFLADECLRENSGLQDLFLTKNEISDAGAVKLLTAVLENARKRAAFLALSKGGSGTENNIVQKERSSSTGAGAVAGRERPGRHDGSTTSRSAGGSCRVWLGDNPKISIDTKLFITQQLIELGVPNLIKFEKEFHRKFRENMKTDENAAGDVRIFGKSKRIEPDGNKEKLLHDFYCSF
ncbi:unnamed protein product [Amoebophrya sp. A120]|nr:unnamed protein product [Amoebophrya sp. A120]|eukprot:GSA120T00014770001.1